MNRQGRVGAALLVGLLLGAGCRFDPSGISPRGDLEPAPVEAAADRPANPGEERRADLAATDGPGRLEPGTDRPRTDGPRPDGPPVDRAADLRAPCTSSSECAVADVCRLGFCTSAWGTAYKITEFVAVIACPRPGVIGWDGDGSDPDPKLDIFISGLHLVTKPQIKNQCSPVWTAFTTTPALKSTDTLELRLYDEDGAVDELIGSVIIGGTALSDGLHAGVVTSAQPPSLVNITLELEPI